MKISRVWAMPNKWTFQIPPIRELLIRYNVGKGWFDPFSGSSRIAEFNNDHRDLGQSSKLDAGDFVRQLQGEFDGCLFDPPYSHRQAKEHYDEIGLKYDFTKDPTYYLKEVRDLAAKKIKMGGRVIYFGWNSNAFGKKRGFEIEEILLVAHGGKRNDTICTVEVKQRNFST